MNGNQARLVASDTFRGHRYGSNHPLSIPRVSLTLDLIRSLNALSEGEFIEARPASVTELGKYHQQHYIQAMQQAQKQGKVDKYLREQYCLGTLENPFFPGFFDIPALATGASIQAAQCVLDGYSAFAPAGGMHHAMPGQAQGFCFFNDVVLAIMHLREAGKRVLYVDLDAHHGDGVEYAFAGEQDVFCFSLHMDTQYAYPFRGGDWLAVHDNVLNIPLPQACDDDTYRQAFSSAFTWVCQRFDADCIVVQAGTDMLSADPLGKLNLSTALFLDIYQQLFIHAPLGALGNRALLTLGGGGYQPHLLARCWTALWLVQSGRSLPECLPDAAQQLLRYVEWYDELDEAVYETLCAEIPVSHAQDHSAWLQQLQKRLHDDEVNICL